MPHSATETITFKNRLGCCWDAPLSGGMAALTTSSLAAGIYTITAGSPGDADFRSQYFGRAATGSKFHYQSVTQTTLVSSLNPSVYGQRVTWTATVTTSGSVPPTGKANFTWGYNIGTVTLNASGVAALTKSNLMPILSAKGGVRGDASNLGSTASPS